MGEHGHAVGKTCWFGMVIEQADRKVQIGRCKYRRHEAGRWALGQGCVCDGEVMMCEHAACMGNADVRI